MPIKIAVAGSSGRMGRALIELVSGEKECTLVAALDRPGSAALGQEVNNSKCQQSKIYVTDDLSILKKAHILIDFTRPEGTLAHIEQCCKYGVNMVIGTTGFQTLDKIKAASEQIGIVYSQNMSIGMNVIFKLMDTATHIFSTGYDIEILEMHHRKKVDAPSGTALKMGQILAKAMGYTLEECAVYNRNGITGPRDPSSIGFASLRGGDVVGDHTVIFAGTGERIEIAHKASSRSIYAQGSLLAAKFLFEKKRGLFDMQDVLGLK